MASNRALTFINNQNHANGNQFAEKNILSLKGSDQRSALKNLTNDNKSQQHTIVHQDGKGKGSCSVQEKQIKSAMSKIVHRIGLSNENAAPGKRSHSSSYEKSSPHYAEYAWGQASCLRDDLLEQMIEFNGVSHNVKRKPLPPVRPDPLDLPDLDENPWTYDDEFWPSKEQRFSSLKPLDLPDLPLMDIQELEFIF